MHAFREFDQPLEGTVGNLCNGVLEIAASIAAAALPRKIEVKSLPTAKGAGA